MFHQVKFKAPVFLNYKLVITLIWQLINSVYDLEQGHFPINCQVHKQWTQVFFSFIFIFIFFLIYFFIFLFLEHRVRIGDSHKSQDTEKEEKGSRTNDVILYGYYMLASCPIYGCLGQNCYNSETLVLVWEKNLVQGLHKKTQWRTLYRIYLYLYSLVLGPCYDYATPTLKFMLLPHVLLLIHHKATIPYACILMSYSLISAVHVYTMCIP